MAEKARKPRSQETHNGARKVGLQGVLGKVSHLFTQAREKRRRTHQDAVRNRRSKHGDRETPGLRVNQRLPHLFGLELFRLDPDSALSDTCDGEGPLFGSEPERVRGTVGKEEEQDRTPGDRDGAEDDKDQLPLGDFEAALVRLFDTGGHERADHAAPADGRVPDRLAEWCFGAHVVEPGHERETGRDGGLEEACARVESDSVSEEKNGRGPKELNSERTTTYRGRTGSPWRWQSLCNQSC